MPANAGGATRWESGRLLQHLNTSGEGQRRGATIRCGTSAYRENSECRRAVRAVRAAVTAWKSHLSRIITSVHARADPFRPRKPQISATAGLSAELCAALQYPLENFIAPRLE